MLSALNVIRSRDKLAILSTVYCRSKQNLSEWRGVSDELYWVYVLQVTSGIIYQAKSVKESDKPNLPGLAVTSTNHHIQVLVAILKIS